MAVAQEVTECSWRLGDRTVPYTLVRSQRRTVGLRIDHRGLRVGAPLKARPGDIETMLREHAAWIVEKLSAWQEKPSGQDFILTDGQTIPLLGQPCTVQILEGSNRVFWHKDDQRLSLLPRPGTDPLALLEHALRAKAREHFKARLAFFSQAMALQPPPLSLSSARTRWGSCSRTGIRLNWRLIHLPPDVVDYVVVHELAHLREMNHSPRFWAVVESAYPDWQLARKRLRQLAPEIPAIQSPGR